MHSVKIKRKIVTFLCTEVVRSTFASFEFAIFTGLYRHLLLENGLKGSRSFI